MTGRGTIGGHRGTKIYGRLDCPSALRAIARGGYVKYRVFFADEARCRRGGLPAVRCVHAGAVPQRGRLVGQPATQNDDVVHPRALLSLGADGLPLDGIDTDSLDLTLT